MSPNIARFFPFLRWPRPVARDFWAGISVGLILVPQALGYATLAGVPPYVGLYAAMLPGIVGVLWGSSALLAAGPVALTSILVFGSLSGLASPGSGEWVALAIWLALYAGVIQFLLGAFKMGKIAYLVSQPVVLGFTNAAAVIVIFSQLSPFFGIDIAVRQMSVTLNPASAITSLFGIVALLALLLFRRFAPTLPGILFVTIGGIVASRLLGYAGQGGAVIGTLPLGLPSLSLPPAISFDSHRELWPAALIVAVVSFTEAMSSCRILARKTNERWDENQELIGQGMAKLASGLSGAFPVSGSFSRSALNLYAGARSGWSALAASACVLVTLLFFTPLIADLPYSVLAAVIFVPVAGLLDLKGMRRLARISRDDALVAAVTFAVTLAFTPRLHFGVFAGIGLTMVAFLYRRTHPRLVEVSEHPDGTLRDRARFSLPRLAPDVLAVRMDSALNFLTGATLERFIVERVEADVSIKRVLLCASGINDIDASGIDALAAIHYALAGKDVSLYLTNVKKQVWDVVGAAGMATLLHDQTFATDRDAMIALRR